VVARPSEAVIRQAMDFHAKDLESQIGLRVPKKAGIR
jgi:hypothetical protein